MSKTCKGKIKALSFAIAVAAGYGTQAPLAAAADSVTDAITGGKASADVRLRYEDVSDDAVAKDGKALTVRTRLGYTTGDYLGFSVVGEFEDVHTLFGVDNYAPESAGYATIADPTGTDLNQAALHYKGVSGLDLGYGRQHLTYDNQRFIGDVGWRQREQTFDGFTAAYDGLPGLHLNYAYLTGVKGITPQFDSTNISDNLINVSYSGFSWGTFTAYDYLLDHRDETDTTVNAGLRFKTNDTWGLRFDGGYVLAAARAVKLLYTLEYARQHYEDTAGTVKRDANYKFGELGVGYTLPAAVLTVKASYEQLGSDGGVYGFQTPFATKHAFNGWADKFLVTPAAGLEDKFATVGVKLPAYGVNMLAVYHDFTAAKGSGDFGNEWDLLVAKAFGPHYTVGVKYAAYSAQDLPYRNTDKVWVWGELKF